MKYSNTLSTDSGTTAVLRQIRPDLEMMIRRQSRLLHPVPTETLPVLKPLEGVRAVLFDIYGTLIISASGEVGSLAARDYSKDPDDGDGKTGCDGSKVDEGCDDVTDADGLTGAQPFHFYRTLSSAGYVIEGAHGDSDHGAFDERVRETYTRLILEEHERKKKLGVDFPEVDILSIWHRLITTLLEKGEIRSPGPIPEPDSELLIKLSLRYELMANRVWPMPGALESLEYLHGRGFRLGIVSNAQFYTSLIFETIFGNDLGSLGFREELCEWSYVCGRAKPSPEMFTRVLEVLEKTGITPEEVLYVGNDMLNDVYTAGTKGCRTCLFAGDTRSLRLRNENPQLHSLHPDGIINRLSQLSQLLGTGPEGTL